MRRRKAEKRDVQPDPIFEDKLITRFVNNLMRDGKKNVARKIVYQAFELIEERTGETGLEVFRAALQNSTPVVEVKSRRVGASRAWHSIRNALVNQSSAFKKRQVNVIAIIQRVNRRFEKRRWCGP